MSAATRPAGLAAVLVLTVLLTACVGEGGEDAFTFVPATETETPEPTASARTPGLAATLLPAATASPAATPVPATATPSAAATPPPATATPAPQATASPSPTTTPEPTPAALPPPGLAAIGDPFSSSDLAEAVEARGWVIGIVGAAPMCQQTAVTGEWLGSGRTDGSGGPAFALWVYPDRAAAERDWELVPRNSPRPLSTACVPGTGFIYWNENLILSYAPHAQSGELLTASGSGHPVVQAFLSLSR